jgi:predicted transcriptional regulator
MKMATIEELVKQYHEDPEFKKEVQDILADGQITIDEFMSFAKKHKVNVTLFDLPIVIAEAKKRGLL